jgi:cytochrome c-type biogenesis protein CcmH/NrfG
MLTLFHTRGFFLAFLLLTAVPAFAQFPGQTAPRGPGGDTRENRQFSVRGWVSDSVTHRRIESVRIELRATTGAIVGSSFTRGNGDFEFNDVPEGSYNLTAVEANYETTTQEVQVVFGPVLGVDVEMRPKPDSHTPTAGAPSKVSVRDLSIPRKARDAMNNALNLLYTKSDYKGSIKQFERAIQEYPDYYEAYAAMSIAYLRQNDSATAEQNLRKSIEVSHEKYVQGYCMLADLLATEKHYADAQPLAQKAIELDSESWQANSELARALLGLDQSDEAEPSAEKAVMLAPDNPQLRLLLADIHLSEQKYQPLLDDFNAYLKLAPNGELAERVRKQRDELQQQLAASEPSPASDPKPQP